MSNKTIPNRSAEPQASFVRKPISRRQAVAGLLGTAGVIGAWQPVAARPQAQGACQPGSDFAAALQQSQLDYTNQGLAIIPGKGLVATFGNSFYRFDAATSTYSLCRNGNEIFRGRVRTDIQGTRSVFTEEIEPVGATVGGKAVRLVHVVDVLDITSPNLKAQATLDAGFVGEASTFWFSTVYDINAQAFAGLMVKGIAPTIDLSPFRPLGRLIRVESGGKILPPGPDLICFNCQLSASLFCDIGLFSLFHNPLCGKLRFDCSGCGIFPF